MGVVLAGVFTEGALTQLKSLGFGVLYFPYETVVKAFSKFGIDASFDEKTAESDFKNKIESWHKLPNKKDVARELMKINKQNVDEFLHLLSAAVSRFIEYIIILPLHGQESVACNAVEAIDYLKEYMEDVPNLPLSKYEIIIKYNTGDRIEASFRDKKDSVRFLETYI